MQCPHCTFYKVDSELVEMTTPTGSYSDPKVGDAARTVVTTGIVWTVGGIIVAIIGSIVGFVIARDRGLTSDDDFRKCVEIVVCVFVFIWTIGCLIVGIRIVANCLSNKGTHYKTETHGYSHYCRHCGYTWHTD